MKPATVINSNIFYVSLSLSLFFRSSFLIILFVSPWVVWIWLWHIWHLTTFTFIRILLDKMYHLVLFCNPINKIALRFVTQKTVKVVKDRLAQMIRQKWFLPSRITWITCKRINTCNNNSRRTANTFNQDTTISHNSTAQAPMKDATQIMEVDKLQRIMVLF